MRWHYSSMGVREEIVISGMNVSSSNPLLEGGCGWAGRSATGLRAWQPDYVLTLRAGRAVRLAAGRCRRGPPIPIDRRVRPPPIQPGRPARCPGARATPSRLSALEKYIALGAVLAYVGLPRSEFRNKRYFSLALPPSAAPWLAPHGERQEGRRVDWASGQRA